MFYSWLYHILAMEPVPWTAEPNVEREMYSQFERLDLAIPEIHSYSGTYVSPLSFVSSKASVIWVSLMWGWKED